MPQGETHARTLLPFAARTIADWQTQGQRDRESCVVFRGKLIFHPALFASKADANGRREADTTM